MNAFIIIFSKMITIIIISSTNIPLIQQSWHPGHFSTRRPWTHQWSLDCKPKICSSERIIIIMIIIIVIMIIIIIIIIIMIIIIIIIIWRLVCLYIKTVTWNWTNFNRNTKVSQIFCVLVLFSSSKTNFLKKFQYLLCLSSCRLVFENSKSSFLLFLSWFPCLIEFTSNILNVQCAIDMKLHCFLLLLFNENSVSKMSLFPVSRFSPFWSFRVFNFPPASCCLRKCLSLLFLFSMFAS